MILATFILPVVATSINPVIGIFSLPFLLALLPFLVVEKSETSRE